MRVFSPPLVLHPSSSLQMFTVLSIDPVAISGEVGEKAHAVTYLQQRTEIEQRGKRLKKKETYQS